MNREEAIAVFKEIKVNYEADPDWGVYDGVFSRRNLTEILDAYSALRDMLKRSEGCDFCNESERIQNQYGDIMEMDEGVLILDTEGYPRVTFRIKYCPDCGRELSGTAEQVKEGGK